jgi:hypothetical protein
MAATFTPSATLPAGTYTARLDASIRATDDATLGSPYSWSFAVASAPAPFVVSSSVPAAGATNIARDVAPTVTFSRSVDPTTVNTGNVRLRDASGSLVAASVTFDAPSLTATLRPSSALAANVTYTLEVTTGVHAADGTPLPSQANIGFTTSPCPCSLFSGLAPASTGNPAQDGRHGPGPWSLELGIKITVDRPVQLTAIRFYKDARETGTHVGRLWSATGGQIASVTFASESPSGWQQQALSSPVTLQSGVVYVLSVNANAYFVLTTSGLATAVSNGPLHSVADGANGVFGASAGTFPTGSSSSSNYFVDGVVK